MPQGSQPDWPQPVTTEVAQLSPDTRAYIEEHWAPLDRYVTRRDEARKAKAEAKDAEEQLAHAESLLLEWLVEQGLAGARHEETGLAVSIRRDVRASIKVDDLEQAAPVLRDIGAGALLQERVNAQTLTSWVKERMAEADLDPTASPLEALPEPLRPYVTVAQIDRISARK